MDKGHIMSRIVPKKLSKIKKFSKDNWKHFVSGSSIVVALCSFGVSLTILHNQQRHNAWSIVSGHVPGNSGIKYALEILDRYELDLRYLNLVPFRSAHAENQQSPAFVGSVDLRSADLHGSWFINTDFSEAKFNRANLSNAKMQDAHFSKAVFIEADLTSVDGKSSDFNSADFTGATLNQASLVSAYLQDAVMIGVKAEDLDVTKATATNLKLDKAILTKAKFNQAWGLGSSFVGADLRTPEFLEARFSGSSFVNAELEEGDFTYAKMHFADFTGATITNPVLFYADFKGTNLSGATFKGEASGMTTANWENVWAWNNQLPVFPPSDEWKKIRAVIELYDPDCREDWNRRIKKENGSNNGKQRLAGVRYRPPENRSGCFVSTMAQQAEN